MLKKIDISRKFLLNNNIFICPICYKNLIYDNEFLICQNNHTFDLSKKGTINLIKTSNLRESSIYNRDLFVNRRNFIKHNFYDDIYEYVSKKINELNITDVKILDLGCGEAIHSVNILNKLKESYIYYGFDYSKVAISLASDYNQDNRIFFNADVNNIPLCDNSIDVIIDFLLPYSELEVKRVLKNNGIFIKVTPGQEYLKELRNALNMDEYAKEEEVFDNIKNKFNVIETKRIVNTYDVNEEDCKELVQMTPLKINKKSLLINKITIDLNIYTIVVR